MVDSFLVKVVLSFALGSWIYHALMDERGKRTAAGNWICHNFFDKSESKNHDVSTDDDDEGLILETREVSPTHFLTKIESFSLFFDYGIDKYETKEFEAGDYKWRLIIYPNGKKKDDNYVSVYLAMVETNSLPLDWEFNAIFSIFLYNQISDNYLCFRVNGARRFNTTKFNWGFPKFISKESLRDESNGYLVDDNFILGAEVFVLKRQRVIENVTLLKPTIYQHTHEWKIVDFSKLKKVWESEEFTINNVKWKVKLYPNGISSPRDRDLSIYLVCVSVDAHKRIKADYCTHVKGIGVRSSDILSRWFTPANKSWRHNQFITLDTLPNDCFVIEVEISMQEVERFLKIQE
ncbi:hypothetical protein ACP275_10G173900 [Erythranthe tilingii]